MLAAHERPVLVEADDDAVADTLCELAAALRWLRGDAVAISGIARSQASSDRGMGRRVWPG